MATVANPVEIQGVRDQIATLTANAAEWRLSAETAQAAGEPFDRVMHYAALAFGADAEVAKLQDKLARMTGGTATVDVRSIAVRELKDYLDAMDWTPVLDLVRDVWASESGKAQKLRTIKLDFDFENPQPRPAISIANGTGGPKGKRGARAGSTKMLTRYAVQDGDNDTVSPKRLVELFGGEKYGQTKAYGLMTPAEQQALIKAICEGEGIESVLVESKSTTT